MHRQPASHRRTAADTHRPSVDTPLKSWVPRGRRLVLIDLENLVGGSEATAAEVAEALDLLRTTLGTDPDDVRVVSCGPTLLSTAMSVISSTRVSLGRGIDGADHRLLEAMAPADVVGRFRSVVLVSADGAAFAGRVEQLAALGVPTDVVVGAGALSRRLAAAARSVVSVHHSRFAVAA